MAQSSAQQKTRETTTAVLPDLPYAIDDLEPHLSAETLQYHYGKHHQKYVNTLNELAEGTEFENMTLEQIICQADGKVYNNAAQIWNHTFYWYSFSPDGKREPLAGAAKKLSDNFGSFEQFKEKFNSVCMGLFGSGWVWLSMDSDGQLSIDAGKDADNPLREGKTPLLTCDMWEHAYYIDYRNDKQSYLDAFWQLVDWKVIEDRMTGK
jgi:Fe-Mn family superoxide dismutase